jgi:hypothetical protein
MSSAPSAIIVAADAHSSGTSATNLSQCWRSRLTTRSETVRCRHPTSGTGRSPRGGRADSATTSEWHTDPRGPFQYATSGPPRRSANCAISACVLLKSTGGCLTLISIAGSCSFFMMMSSLNALLAP